MDTYRVMLAGLLVLILFVVIIWAIAKGYGSDATQFATPVSGLAGIAIGWLFTTGSAALPTSGHERQSE
jgi:hypothetical protein